jgi:hypothetical protein
MGAFHFGVVLEAALTDLSIAERNIFATFRGKDSVTRLSKRDDIQSMQLGAWNVSMQVRANC